MENVLEIIASAKVLGLIGSYCVQKNKEATTACMVNREGTSR